MKISGNEIKIGNIIELDGQLWIAVKTMHTQPGKGGAYMQVELKNIQTGTKKNERFRAAESVLRVYLDEQEYSFLYQEGERYIFMDQTTFEQVSLEASFIGDLAPFLQDGMMVQISMHEGSPINMRLPEHVTLEVTEADAVVKGQTASSSFKPAILENGVRIMVPPHITAGMRVVVNTSDATYVERAKD